MTTNDLATAQNLHLLAGDLSDPNASTASPKLPPIEFIGAFEQDFIRTIKALLVPYLHEDSGVSKLLVFNGVTTIDTAKARTIIEGGGTVAIVNARTGQLADLYPGTGCEVTCDVPLFALKRTPVPGSMNATHSVITILENPKIRATTPCVVKSVEETTWAAVNDSQISAETIAEELKTHMLVKQVFDDTLIPPDGAFYGIISYNIAWSTPLTQSYFPYLNGNTQTLSFRSTLTYYVYFANGAGQAPQYVILLIESGNMIPATGGSQALCAYGPGEVSFVLAKNKISNLDVSGQLSLVNQSPANTTSSPVVDTIDYPMTVLARNSGGFNSTAFSVSTTASTANDGWGVDQNGDPSANEAAWQFYNNTLWNASTQDVNNWSQWSSNLYDHDDLLYNNFGSQCLNGASFHTMSVWTIPQNPGNASPLNIQFEHQNWITVQGFANSGNSPTGSDQMIDYNYWFSHTNPAWNLVALTNPTNRPYPPSVSLLG